MWTYAPRTAILRRDGVIFAVVSPDGHNALSLVAAAALLDALNRRPAGRPRGWKLAAHEAEALGLGVCACRRLLDDDQRRALKRLRYAKRK